MLALTQLERNPWSIFDELDSLQEEFNRAFSAGSDSFRKPRARRNVYPAVNVWSSDEGLIIDAELPGVDARDIDIAVVGDELALSGGTPVTEAPDGTVYHRRERCGGRFSRKLQLPFRADAGRVKATHRNGLLRITVPRSEEEKPKRIPVKG